MIELPPDLVARAAARPERFAPHEARFWDDPWIATRMLAAHLDPATDAASRRPAVIDRTVAHLAGALALAPGDRLLDLGCGPGLYAVRFARRGIRVTGFDLSEGSLAHAREAAAAEGLAVDWRQGDYTRDALGGPYDAAICVYLDLGVLNEAALDRVLDALRAALVPGGRLAFDVAGMGRVRPRDGAVEVSPVDGPGFWRPGPHAVVASTHRFGRDLDLRQYGVVDPDGTLTVYRVWDRAFAVGGLRALLGRHGFRLVAHWADIAGTPWRRGAPELAVLAVRR